MDIEDLLVLAKALIKITRIFTADALLIGQLHAAVVHASDHRTGGNDIEIRIRHLMGFFENRVECPARAHAEQIAVISECLDGLFVLFKNIGNPAVIAADGAVKITGKQFHIIPRFR